jgi:hypothetical protein
VLENHLNEKEDEIREYSDFLSASSLKPAQFIRMVWYGLKKNVE